MESKHKGYFEGVLQLRNPNKEVLHFVREMFERRENVWIAKEERVANGIDVYVSSQKYLQIVGKQLQNKFGGEFKISRRLFSSNRLTSKTVYRVTVLFRMPTFKKGDIVRVKGEQIKVINMGRKVYGADVETGKKVSFDYDDVQN